MPFSYYMSARMILKGLSDLVRKNPIFDPWDIV
jgi:hypothetical protein